MYVVHVVACIRPQMAGITKYLDAIDIFIQVVPRAPCLRVDGKVHFRFVRCEIKGLSF